jgi:hypothetical protein
MRSHGGLYLLVAGLAACLAAARPTGTASSYFTESSGRVVRHHVGSDGLITNYFTPVQLTPDSVDALQNGARGLHHRGRLPGASSDTTTVHGEEYALMELDKRFYWLFTWGAIQTFWAPIAGVIGAVGSGACAITGQFKNDAGLPQKVICAGFTIMSVIGSVFTVRGIYTGAYKAWMDGLNAVEVPMADFVGVFETDPGPYGTDNWYSLSRRGETINRTQVHEAADTYWKEYLASDAHNARLHIAADYELANMTHIAQTNSTHRLPVAYVTNGTVFHPHVEIWQSYNETRGSVQLHASAPTIQRYIYAEEKQKRDEGTVPCGNNLINVGLQNGDDICIYGQDNVAGYPDVMFYGVDMYGGQDGYNAVDYDMGGVYSETNGMQPLAERLAEDMVYLNYPEMCLCHQANNQWVDTGVIVAQSSGNYQGIPGQCWNEANCGGGYQRGGQ